MPGWVEKLMSVPSPDSTGARPRPIDADRVRLLLGKRPEIAKIKKRTERTLSLTETGRKQSFKKIIERNTLTSEDLESGAWREIKLRPYDVKLAARLEEDFAHDWAQSTPVTLEEWEKRPMSERVVELLGKVIERQQ